MNPLRILSTSVTIALFGLLHTASHGNPADLPFGLELDMDREAVVKHLESNDNFKRTSPPFEYDSEYVTVLSYATNQELNGITFNRVNIYFFSEQRIGVDGIFRVDLNSDTTKVSQDPYERLIHLGEYFKEEGLQSEVDRFESIQTFGDLMNQVVLVYSEDPTTIHVTSRFEEIRDKPEFLAQISWINNSSVNAFENEYQSSPSSVLEIYYATLEYQWYFIAELLCTPEGMMELEDWKVMVDNNQNLLDLVWRFEVDEVTIDGSSAFALISTPVNQFTALTAQVDGVWKIRSAFSFD